MSGLDLKLESSCLSGQIADSDHGSATMQVSYPVFVFRVFTASSFYKFDLVLTFPLKIQ